jgi:aspartate aminotransferase
MRKRLVEDLRQAGSTHNWSHISSQIGMFAYTGMTADMVDELTARYAIFMTRDGRISLAGLNEQNVRYVAEAIHSVTDGKSITHSI